MRCIALNLCSTGSIGPSIVRLRNQQGLTEAMLIEGWLTVMLPFMKKLRGTRRAHCLPFKVVMSSPFVNALTTGGARLRLGHRTERVTGPADSDAWYVVRLI